MSEKKLKVVFAEGCFDNFEGTPEEMQEMIAEIHRLVETGEIFEQAVPVAEEDIEEIEILEANKNTRQ